MANCYILDDDGVPVRTTVQAWAALRDDQKRVALTELGDVRVSTVFLGLDHDFSGKGPPILWETMVFGGPHDGDQDRYTSHADALAGHEAMVERVSRG